MSVAELQQIYQDLDEKGRDALLSYARFLGQQEEETAERSEALPKEQPQEIPRPEKERVIHAIRRLTETYPMLKHEHLLKQSADLMSAHLVSGRAADEVIDELESLFRQHYQQYLDE